MAPLFICSQQHNFLGIIQRDNHNEDIFLSDFFLKVTMLDFSLNAAMEAGKI
ncbi:MAG: hypothetical protein JWQ09_4235 [Segetibacter sp.]|nr:hypothetical protein [Segetibacter sp.]